VTKDGTTVICKEVWSMERRWQ